MTDVAEAMAERAWSAYQEYLSLPSTKGTLDFEAFSVGFFLGALASVRKPLTYKRRGETQ